MSRPVLILTAVALAAVTLFCGSFFVVSHLSSRHGALPTDELEWLRMEFHLSHADLEGIRKLHEGYLPVCHGFCAQIAAEKVELAGLVEAGQGGSEAASECLNEIGRLRAQCQAAMLKHFEEVSRAMPPEQGPRYLEEMRRLTLGFHEEIEDSMAGNPGNAHAHH